MKRLYLLLTTAVLLLCGCQTEETPEQLFDECRSGVVLILNQYYYKLNLSDGTTFYFTGTNQDGTYNFVNSVDELQGQRAQSYGTGFFIDDNGTIMTNRHVAVPQIDKDEVKKQLNNIIAYLERYCEYQMQQLGEEYEQLQEQKQQCNYWEDGNEYIDQEQLDRIEQQQQVLSDRFDSLSTVKQSFEQGMLTLDDIHITPVCQLGIAYDGSHVNSSDDFLLNNPCLVQRVSAQEDTDLALIRLKSGKTPDNCHVFDVDAKTDEPSLGDRLKSIFGKEEKKGLRIDQELYMIGYNAGPILANTRQGIKVQMTSGKITQVPDGDKLLYSIPTVQGSSGSPVIDAEGNLAAVNFAKLAISDNFNFGIPMAKVRAFMQQH